ncbi:MAG: septum formation initiator family protein [Candidatus Omnitrophota bacterium]
MAKKAFLLLGLGLFLLAIFLPGFSRIKELRRENSELDRRIARMQRENNSFARKKTLLEKDDLYIEKIARRKMGLTRKGETVYRLVPKNNP